LLKEKGMGGTAPDFQQGTTPQVSFVPQTQGTQIPASIRGALADISNIAANYK
jgi:hypothetical protein